ncbi:hypothetical protein INS49_010130 [Diaporthe citri]|uniref:uncharacterized protein n=1 Tax=Diaporthe citri TaxID=83186 RepID=UPI001C81868C|nr:uncharacterized protein INS49_010130 [Diaporthe citri]KAG6361901.1 hypothetical protein INS49_010130 [Diaporthe citri]
MPSNQHGSNSPAADGQEPPAQTEHLNIKVTDNNNELIFKIKKSTKLEKLMDSFCERHGKTLDSVRFLFEGKRVQGSETPDSLEMEDGDTIEVYQEQLGGNGLCTRRAKSENAAGDDTVSSTPIATPTDGNPPARKQKFTHESDVTEKKDEVSNEGEAVGRNGGIRDGLAGEAEVEGQHGEEGKEESAGKPMVVTSGTS